MKLCWHRTLPWMRRSRQGALHPTAPRPLVSQDPRQPRRPCGRHAAQRALGQLTLDLKGPWERCACWCRTHAPTTLMGLRKGANRDWPTGSQQKRLHGAPRALCQSPSVVPREARSCLRPWGRTPMAGRQPLKLWRRAPAACHHTCWRTTLRAPHAPGGAAQAGCRTPRMPARWPSHPGGSATPRPSPRTARGPPPAPPAREWRRPLGRMLRPASLATRRPRRTVRCLRRRERRIPRSGAR